MRVSEKCHSMSLYVQVLCTVEGSRLRLLCFFSLYFFKNFNKFSRGRDLIFTLKRASEIFSFLKIDLIFGFERMPGPVNNFSTLFFSLL